MFFTETYEPRLDDYNANSVIRIGKTDTGLTFGVYAEERLCTLIELKGV